MTFYSLEDAPLIPGQVLKIAFLESSPSTAECAELRTLGLDGFELLLDGRPADDALSWLAGFENVRHLGVDSRRLPRIPREILQSVESLSLTAGTAVEPIEWGWLESATIVEVSCAISRGRPRHAPALEQLTLRTFPFDDLTILEGCARLHRVSLNGRNREVAFDAGSMTPPLEELATSGLWPISFDGVARFTGLKRLSVAAGKQRAREAPLDLSPLEQCPDLEVVRLGNVGPYIHTDRLAQLPTIKTLRIG